MKRLIIITGYSGSGKSTALNSLQDHDFYPLDNLPIKLLPKFIELLDAGQSVIERAALVMDLRDPEFARLAKEVFTELRQNYDFVVDILFLEANEENLLKRFSETRRKHPMSEKSVAEGIASERKVLEPLREMATEVIDTSGMDVHSLKRNITERFVKSDNNRLAVRVFSFGYKNGVPKNCDLLLDVRFLKNPHFEDSLRAMTGLEAPVQEFIQTDERFGEFVNKTLDYLSFLIPQYQTEGKRYLSIGIGCTGGKHRSVYCTERLKAGLSERFLDKIELNVEHQDLPTA